VTLYLIGIGCIAAGLILLVVVAVVIARSSRVIRKREGRLVKLRGWW
jgi:hypothetical protein